MESNWGSSMKGSIVKQLFSGLLWLWEFWQPAVGYANIFQKLQSWANEANEIHGQFHNERVTEPPWSILKTITQSTADVQKFRSLIATCWCLSDRAWGRRRRASDRTAETDEQGRFLQNVTFWGYVWHWYDVYESAHFTNTCYLANVTCEIKLTHCPLVLLS